jgi:hypothetical protein
MKTTRFLIEKTLEKPAKSGWDWLTTVTKCFKFLCVALVKTGECRDIPEAAKKLADKAMDRLEEMEKVYGSADNFIERKTSDEILTYSKARIDTKLKALEEKDDADTWVMLADAANHLFFILAKVKLEQSSDGAG